MERPRTGLNEGSLCNAPGLIETCKPRNKGVSLSRGNAIKGNVVTEWKIEFADRQVYCENHTR